MRNQHRKGRRRKPSAIALYRLLVFGTMCGGMAKTLTTVDLQRNTMDWRWAAGGIFVAVAVMLVFPEPRPRPKPTVRRPPTAKPAEPEPAELSEPLTLPVTMPLVDTGGPADLAALLRHVEVTVLDGTEFASMPTPTHLEPTRYWLEDFTEWLRLNGTTSDQVAARVGALRPTVGAKP